MEAAEIAFEIVIADVDETNPPGMAGELVPEHLAKKKAAAIEADYPEAIIIAADTVVLLDGEYWESLQMLQMPKIYYQSYQAEYTGL